MSDETRRETEQTGSTLVLMGVNHQTAPIDVRERLAIPAGQLAKATRSPPC